MNKESFTDSTRMNCVTNPESESFLKMSPDLIRKMAIDMNYDDIMNLCLTDKKLHKILYNNINFWRERARHQFQTNLKLKQLVKLEIELKSLIDFRVLRYRGIALKKLNIDAKLKFLKHIYRILRSIEDKFLNIYNKEPKPINFNKLKNQMIMLKSPADYVTINETKIFPHANWRSGESLNILISSIFIPFQEKWFEFKQKSVDKENKYLTNLDLIAD